MILKITVVFCAVMLVGAEWNLQKCDPNYWEYKARYCKASASEDKHKTWYQGKIFLQVDDGVFTVELLANDSNPSVLNAEGKGIIELKRGFARIASLEWLSLEDNLISRINESSVFEGLPQLVYLSLAHNRIEYLEKDAFQGLTKLEILNLNHNSLKDQISFSMNDNTLPALTQLYLRHNQLAIVSINSHDVHGSNLCNSNLEYLHLSNNSIRWFGLEYGPREHCLKKLTHLFLDDNEIENDLYMGKAPLEALSLDGNYIAEIPVSISPELKFLSLSRNRIKYVRNLKNAKDIVRLILSYNIITNSVFDENFQNFTSLEHLALDHNFLTSIPDGFFHNLTSLKNLYITDNRINEISPNAFAHLPALQKLSFSNNQLTSFPGQKSFGDSNLTYLDFSYNKVENVSDLEANMIPTLKELKLTGNPLKRMEPTSVSNDTTILS